MKPQHAKLLAYYHLAGGLLGCLLIMIALFGASAPIATEVLVYCGAFLLFSLSIYCGYLGLKGSAPQFLRVAFALQLIQVVMFSFDRVIAYKFFSGLALVIGVPLHDALIVNFKLHLSTFLVSWKQPMDSFIGVNLVAISLALWIAANLKIETRRIDSKA